MPYCTEEAKHRIDHGNQPQNVGELTYKLTSVIQAYLHEHGLRYQQVAEISGALHQCSRDFDERIVMPYEATKVAENGDVWDSSLIATNR